MGVGITSHIGLHKALHESNPLYGSGIGKVDKILRLCENNLRYKEVLDYGCGKGYLSNALLKERISCWQYDPAIEKFSNKPMRDFDLVVAINVFECLDARLLKNNINEIFSLAKHAIFATISCCQSKFFFPNSRNVNSVILDREQWVKTFRSRKEVIRVFEEYDEEEKSLDLLIMLHANNFCYKCRVSSIYNSESKLWECPKCGFGSVGTLYYE